LAEQLGKNRKAQTLAGKVYLLSLGSKVKVGSGRNLRGMRKGSSRRDGLPQAGRQAGRQG